MKDSVSKNEQAKIHMPGRNKIIVSLCVISALIVLQVGFYVVVYLTRANNPGRYLKNRRGSVSMIKEGTPYIDTKINISEYSFAQVFQYFNEVALSDESHHYKDVVRKWTTPVLFYAEGDIDDLVEDVLSDLFAKMNSVEGFPGIFRVNSKEEANLVGYFYNDESFLSFVKEYNGDEYTYGISKVETNPNDYSISNGFFIARNEMSTVRRRHVISEELIQAMGLQNDSYMYPESLFYKEYCEVTGPNDLDWIIFKVLYHPLIQSGMNYNQVFPVLLSILQH